MPASIHSIRFHGETAEYRDARDKLLQAEIALRKNIEEVAALRRKLPVGGLLAEDYVFEEGAADLNDTATSRNTRLSELFSPGKETLAIYSYMFGPQMAAPCVSCTSILDGLNGSAPHIRQRMNFAVVAKSPLARIREVARGRGWNNLRLLSSSGNTYNRDYQGENAKGEQTPSLNIFVRRDGKIYHFYNTELLFAPTEPGMDGRHVDMIWPVWNMFDYTPEGRGKDWYPKLSYESQPLQQVKKA
ncbi:MAG TPA: DUF899 family protein [Candidatus Angelobacter sp.]|nr:DUF899 family protein [Candidatus Angelobacter sp.]